MEGYLEKGNETPMARGRSVATHHLSGQVDPDRSVVSEELFLFRRVQEGSGWFERFAVGDPTSSPPQE